MRVADYIYKTLADWGVRHVFLVTGGGAMHLDDAIGREKRIQYVCNLHEQACAMAAEGYARISGMPGVVTVTTGPGGTNAITGVAGAWLDSIPMLVISGQIKTQTCISSYPELKLRQLGDQELNIVDIVKPITKYAVMIREVSEVKDVLSKAWRICQTGRPGPVWIDVPLNIQAAEMPENEISATAREQDVLPKQSFSQLEWNMAMERLKASKRPVIVAGIGVRHAKAIDDMLEFATMHEIPILTSISGIDLIPSDHPLFFGRPGILGERAANFIMQNSDCLLVLGTRMGIRIIGYAFEKIAREAYKIMVDVDEAELNKPTFKPDCKLLGDVGEFLRLANATWRYGTVHGEWLDYCNKVKKKYPVVLDEHRNRTDYVSSYVLPNIISNACRGDEIVVTGNGTAYTSTFQAISLKKGMRMFSNEGCASMGYGLPAAIGAAFAGNGRKTICITGDGSLQMNIQELQTILTYKLPIKLFVYNNDGYLSIKITQRSFFNGHFVGSTPESGVVLPSLKKIALAYGIPYYRLINNKDAEQKVPEIMVTNDCAIIEVMTDPYEILGPKAASKKLPDGTMVSAPLEDMAPFLPRDEFRSNMLVGPIGNF